MVTANDALLTSWDLSLHGKQPRTRKLYRDELERFTGWLTTAGHSGDLLDVDRRTVEAYIAAMQERGLAKATIRSRWIALRSFYAWCVEEEELAASPVAKVVVDRPEPPITPLLDDDGIRKLLAACTTKTPKGKETPPQVKFSDRRDLALVRTLMATGLRASELCALRLDDVDLRDRVVHVRSGKGGRARLVRFDPVTGQALDRYLRVRARHRLAHRPELWLGHRGPVTRKGLGPILRKRCDLAGLPAVNPHALRHLFASRFLEAGGQEGDLQRLGGWSDPSMMRRYGAARAVDRALAAYDAAPPLGNL